MRKFLLIFTTLAVIIPLLGPITVHAEPPCAPTDPTCAAIGYDTSVKNTTGLIAMINNLLKWAQYFFFFLAAAFVLWSALDYLTSGGDETKIKNARNRLVFSLVAVAIALVAGGLPRIVAEVVQ